MARGRPVAAVARAELRGFKSKVVSSVVVSVDTQTRVNLDLDVGEISELLVVARWRTAAGSSPRKTRIVHQSVASAGSAFGRAPKIFHSCRSRSRHP